MGDNTPWFLMHPREEVPSSNAGMVQDLVHSGSLRSAECTAAFQAVDRQHFWPAEGGKFAYHDMPLRSGRLHLSAPHIYAKALESLLPLRPGMSFLNVGSGTGYFNSIVAELIGPLATNHGVDIWPETVAHAERCCRALGKQNIEFTVGNVYQLDVNWTMRYDRIYLGACANSRSKYLYRLLEVGGILIGPFQVGHAQQLRRVVRQSETQFSVEVLGSVQFAPLIEPTPAQPPAPSGAVRAGQATAASFGQRRLPPFSPPPRRGSASRRGSISLVLPGSGAAGPPGGAAAPPRGEPATPGEGAQALGLPGVPFAFSLWERPWTPERSWLYPASFRRTVLMGLLCRPRSPNLACLPTEIWVKHIFPWCPKWWFEAQQPAAAAAPLGQAPREVLPRLCKSAYDSDNDEARRSGREHSSDDDGGSTRAPSANTTPETGPSNPPLLGSADAEVDMALDQDTFEGQDSQGLLFEVFGNGQRHAIGAEDDPDDMEPDEGPRMVVPLQVLELLAADARRRRRREERDDHRGAEDHEDEDDDEEEMMADPEGDDRASEDDEMLDVEEPGVEIDEEAEAAEMAVL